MRSIRLVRCLFTVMWPARVRRNHILLGHTGSRIAAPRQSAIIMFLRFHCTGLATRMTLLDASAT
jgi:hypothetical protein